MNGVDVKFAEWHLANPDFYAFLVKMARKYKAKRPAMRILFALARLEGYKVNDLFCGRYSRLLERQEPDLKGLFSFRRMQT